MASFTTRDEQTNSIVISPKFGMHSGTIILLHGLGDSADGFCDIGETLGRSLPHVKIVIPTAPNLPVTLNGGAVMPAWYDICDFSSNAAEGIEESMTIITSILEQEHAHGLPYSRIALAGFSQGGALSLFLGLQLPVEKKLAGILVLSGYLPADGRFTLTPGLEDVKILHCHGTVDSMVHINKANLTKSLLESKGVLFYDLRPIPGMPHTVTDAVIEQSITFLQDVLPHDEQYIVRPKLPSDMTVKELKAAIRSAGLGAKAVGLSEKIELVRLLEEYNNDA